MAIAKLYCLLLESIEFFIAKLVLMSPSFLFPVFFALCRFCCMRFLFPFKLNLKSSLFTRSVITVSALDHIYLPWYHANMIYVLEESVRRMVQCFPPMSTTASSRVKSGKKEGRQDGWISSRFIDHVQFEMEVRWLHLQADIRLR